MTFIRALIFGVTLAITIGPIALLIIRYAAAEGLGAGLTSACGAALADFTYAVVALSVGTVIAPVLNTYSAQAHRIAAITLIAFGSWLMWTAIRPTPPSSEVTKLLTRVQRRQTPLLTTYALTMSNPLTVIAFLAFIGQLPSDASITIRATAAMGLFLGSLCIQVVLACGGAALGRLATGRRSIQFLNVVSGAGIVFFGVAGLLG
jgi:threonine/homoserine/homoserine lactone efflux protein